METDKIRKFKCDILSNFQTMCPGSLLFVSLLNIFDIFFRLKAEMLASKRQKKVNFGESYFLEFTPWKSLLKDSNLVKFNLPL